MEDIPMDKEGGVPVFRPSMEQFRDFRQFITIIEPAGMEAGIVKVIPPPEWVARLPVIDEGKAEAIKIRHPIEQVAAGAKGVYIFQNLEKSRNYNIHSWHKVCHERTYEPPIERSERNKQKPRKPPGKLPDTPPAEPANILSYDDSSFTGARCDYLEKQYWKSLGLGAAMYGADMPGSLFDESVESWNVANLDSVLRNLPTKIPGVNTAYLYCGMWKATFAWHLEDMDLHSINYIHFGAPKQWYSIPQSHKDKFFTFMRERFPEHYRKCHEFLRHKTFLASPSLLEENGIKVNRIVHRQHEFMITFPYGYHSGFNYDYNVAESVNFATEAWLDIGILSNNCRCIDDAVGIDVARLIRTINGEPEPESESEPEELDSGLHTPPAEPSRKQRNPRKRRRRIYQPSISAHAEGSKAPVKPHSNYTLLPPAREVRSGRCVLCPHRWDDKYLVNAARTALVHESCAQFIPETWIDDDGFVHGLTEIDKNRFGLRCGECRIGLGACFQCAHPKCTRAFHATCAFSAGMVTSDNKYLCRLHRPRPWTPADYGVQMNYAAGLLVGDTVQSQLGIVPGVTPGPSHGRTIAGIVEENNYAEELLLVRCFPNFDDLLEVPWTQVVPGDLVPVDCRGAAVRTKADVDAVVAQEKEAQAVRVQEKAEAARIKAEERVAYEAQLQAARNLASLQKSQSAAPSIGPYPLLVNTSEAMHSVPVYGADGVKSSAQAPHTDTSLSKVWGAQLPSFSVPIPSLEYSVHYPANQPGFAPTTQPTYVGSGVWAPLARPPNT